MPANRRMIEMFHESGFPVEIESSPEGLRVEFPTSLTPEAVARFEERDNLIESPFKGPIYPVNPSADSVQSVPAFASVAAYRRTSTSR
jgi:hypothetical protein